MKHVSTERRGTVVASGPRGSFVVDDGAVSLRCASWEPGLVTMSPRAGVGYGIDPGGGAAQRVTYRGSTCTFEAWNHERPFRPDVALAFDGRNILLAGDPSAGAGVQVAIYDARGRERGRFGNATSGSAPDGFCNVTALSPCRAGVCVLDTNCDRVHVWSRRGEHVGNVRAGELFGLTHGHWLADIEPGARGETFVALGARREPLDAEVAEGVVFLVTGL